MTHPVIVLPGAESDIADAVAWMAEHSPVAAARWLEGIRQAISTLSEMPSRCPVAGDDSAARSSCASCSTADAATDTGSCSL
jgi:plasmid stabilization system protein ParE